MSLRIFNMKLLFSFLCLVVLLSGCRWKETETAEPLELLPDSVTSPIVARFKNATNITGYALEKDRIWAARFQSEGHNYSSVLTKDKLLSTAMLTTEFPDSLKPDLKNLAINGGVFSNLQKLETEGIFNAWQYKCDYLWHGDTYLLTWKRDGSSLTVNMIPDCKFEYKSYSIAQLPVKIQIFLAARNKELGILASEEYTVKIDPQGKKLYAMNVNYLGYGTVLDLLFNDNGDLVATGPFNYAPYIVDNGNKPAKPVDDLSLINLPDNMMKKLTSRPGMDGFVKTQSLFAVWKSVYSSVTSYSASFSKGNESFSYRLNPAGELLTMRYFGSKVTL